jgi:predicted RNA-binding Zn-ribbon protein involved in translation (DUF1610 family)
MSLKTVDAPTTGRAVSAPPILNASDHTVDNTCENCGAVLLHAEEGQVHNLLIHCLECGSYNSTDR